MERYGIPGDGRWKDMMTGHEACRYEWVTTGEHLGFGFGFRPVTSVCQLLAAVSFVLVGPGCADLWGVFAGLVHGDTEVQIV